MLIGNYSYVIRLFFVILMTKHCYNRETYVPACKNEFNNQIIITLMGKLTAMMRPLQGFISPLTSTGAHIQFLVGAVCIGSKLSPFAPRCRLCAVKLSKMLYNFKTKTTFACFHAYEKVSLSASIRPQSRNVFQQPIDMMR